MKFLLDHDVPAAVKDALERHERDVIRLTDLLRRTERELTTDYPERLRCNRRF